MGNAFLILLGIGIVIGLYQFFKSKPVPPSDGKGYSESDPDLGKKEDR